MRLFVEKGISLSEVENNWTLGMVMDANDALDLKEQAEQLAYEQAKAKKD